MSERSVKDIEEELERTRLEMTATVNELAGRLDPKKLGKDAAESAKAKAKEAGDKAKEVLDDARHGDVKSIAIVAGAAAAAVGLIWLKFIR